MSRSKDPLTLSPHWHVDYRIEAELPEDTVVSKRFLINAGFTVLAVAGLVWAGVLAWQARELSGQIDQLEREIRTARPEISAIDAAQAEYDREATKIDQTYALVRPRLFVSEFVAAIARTRPPQLAIDLIEWNDNTVVLRGGLRERNTVASRTLGDYVEGLKRDPTIKPLFQAIQLTNLDRASQVNTLERASGVGVLRFEIKFTLKETK
jgi:outer membrane murein-binding lipoprotein Lpp